MVSELSELNVQHNMADTADHNERYQKLIHKDLGNIEFEHILTYELCRRTSFSNTYDNTRMSLLSEIAVLILHHRIVPGGSFNLEISSDVNLFGWRRLSPGRRFHSKGKISPGTVYGATHFETN